LETDIEINIIPFEEKKTNFLSKVKNLPIIQNPKLADENISHSNHLNKLFNLSSN
jgi:hypothetical protein